MDLCHRTAHELAEMLQSREISALGLCEAVLARVEQVDPKVRAYMTTTPDLARAQAKAVDEKRAAGEDLPTLAGIPLAIKDNMVTVGIPTTCSSKILEGFMSPYDATVVQRVRDAGCVTVGKTNLDEFAMGSSTENSAFFASRNPWDLERAPGGSSGGSAAAVAAGETILALGSDTGGSIRQPASFCGIVGIKPTYGMVSRYGLVAFASSLDQIGPLTKDVRDAALLLDTISGHDPMDSTSVPEPPSNLTATLGQDIRGLRVGVPKEFLGEGTDPEVETAVKAAISQLEGLGAVIGEVSTPHVGYGLPTYYIIAPCEASANLARYDGIRYGHRTAERAGDIIELYERSRGEGFGPEVQRRIMIGTYALSAGYYDAYYLKAQRVRTLLKRDFERAFEQYDVLAWPTSPCLPFRFGEKADPLSMYLADVCTIPVNLVGIPAISLPCGFSKAGLPIGLQIGASYFDEATMLRVAYAYEQSTDFHRARAPLGAPGDAKGAAA